MRRVLPVALTVAALCLTPLSPSPAGAALGGVSTGSAPAAPAPAKVRTQFALAGAAYGTRVEGGSVPLDSKDTAYHRIGCTNLAGTERRNYVADQAVPGLGTIEGATTRVWTRKTGAKVSTYSRHSISRVIIGQPSVGSLELRGVSSTSEAFNKNGRFGTAVDNDVARILFRAAGTPVRELAVPAPGRTLRIPGLATISLGKSVRKVTGDSARISTNAIDISVLALGTRVRVAQTNAAVQDGIRQGVFLGFAAGIEGRGLDDNVRAGRNPLTLVPCRGTLGKTRSKTLQAVRLGDLGTLSGVASGVRAVNRARVAQGTVAGRVSEISLLDGRLAIKGIVGVATVKRDRSVITRNSKGSTVLQIVADGRRYRLPAVGALEIPGLVKLQGRIQQKTKFGLRVVGLRVTLLDGSGSVLDLGVAQLGIRPGVPAAR